MSEELKKCAACRTEKPVSKMKVCMHAEMHRYVCDSKCMADFYSGPKKDATHPAPAEKVEVRGLQWLDTGHYRKKPPKYGYNPHDWNELMTVAQHNRIMASTVPAGCKVVSVELLHDLLDEGPRSDTWAAQDKLRAILEVKP